jgi:multiple sugar transport system permease protein
MRFGGRSPAWFLATALVGLVVIQALFPLVWTFLLSLKTYEQAFARPPLIAFDPTTQNFAYALERIGPYMANSIVVAIASTAISLTCGTLAAYALSRLRIPLKTPFMFGVLVTLLLPPIVVAVPLYLALTRLGVNSTLFAVIVAHALFNTPFVIWIMKAFIDELPIEIEEAALVDGASPIRAFRSVVVPLAAPGLFATAILSLFYSWNEFLLALVVSGSDSRTLPVFISAFQRETSRVLWGELGATIVVAIVPLIMFVVVVQRHLVRGLTFGAVKG